MKIKFVLLIWVLVTLSSFAMAQHTGKVFVDSNGNGVYDKGEQLMSNVSVSDGLHVVKTDKNGTFTLEGHEKERFIFVTTPSGYRTNSSYYKKIKKENTTYNFALSKSERGISKNGTHKFIHISDTEIGEKEGHEDWIGNMRDYVKNNEVAFIFHTGDICYKPGLDSHIEIMNTENMINTQVFYSIGNHDLVAGEYGEEHFERLYGPNFFSFDVGNVHYVVTPMLGGDHWPSYRKKDVYEWLKNDLKHVSKEKSVIMFNHSISDDIKSFKYGINDSEYVDLLSHNLKGWFYGHWHVNHIHKHEGSNVRSVCTSTPIRGGIDHSTSAFRILTVEPDGNFTSDLRYSYLDKSMEIASIQNKQAAVKQSGAIPLSVNIYSTASTVDRVEYKYYLGSTIMSGSKPLVQNTDFNWYADMVLDKKFANEYITVQVEAYLQNGEKIQKEESFKYIPSPLQKINLTAEWPNFLGSPQHVALVQDTLHTPLQLAWVSNLGSNIFMTSPLIYDQTIFVASIDDNEVGKASIAKLNAKTGDIMWQLPIKASIKSSMAITQDVLFAQDVHGFLYAVDVSSGKAIWTKDLKVGMVPPINDGLIAENGIVYAGTGKSLYALEAKTGREIWKNESWNRGEGCTATLSLNNDVLIGHANWGGLYANDARTGEMLWGTGDGELRHRSSSAAMFDGVFYILSSESLFVIESKSGQILMRKKLGYNVNVTSTPLITAKEIIFGTADRGIVALDKETLEEKWNFRTQPAMIYTSPYVRNNAATVEASPVLVGDIVFIGASDGNLYGLNSKNGKQEWKHTVGAPVLASVSVSGNTLFAVDFSGNVYAFTSY